MKPKTPSSIESGSMPWDDVKAKILQFRKKNSDKKTGEWDEQDVHRDLVKWLKETPTAVNYDALATRYRERADHEDRPFAPGQAQGVLFEADPKCVIPYDANKRISLDLARNRHFVGWLEILQENFTNQANAFNNQSAEITKVLALFDEHRDCKNFRALRKYYKKPPEAEAANAK